ncbi:sensor histidine kinase [Massilia sp. erpn]|uniref:sensor histidine kinase n=1 Tax=Massilia sp. erpn TaxID=2738142 RepID=UPI00210404F3|nr:histidine kinase [Massilia sp. erpn]UTY58355.1 histidine kinase [Massilia sp. erpn]
MPLLYSLPMITFPVQQRHWVHALLRIVLVNALIWGLICLFGAQSSYLDAALQGKPRPYLSYLSRWVVGHIPIALFSTGVYAFFARHPRWLGQARQLVTAYLLLALAYLPLECLYYAAAYVLRMDGAFSSVRFWEVLLASNNYSWFFQIAWMSGAYVTIVAICSWRQSTRLRLDLQEQRLQALRGQLEPHFIFNALNAISALVRAGDKPVALSGISRLSELLRYALASSERDTVSVAQELDFIRGYLALQELRYGEKLQWSIGGEAQVRDGDCPPLLLQPLVENAVKHGLERHCGSGDIALEFERMGERMRIRLSNRVSADGNAAPAAGLGIGLRNTAARLQLAYGDDASLRTHHDGQRFQVEIEMPFYLEAA